MQKDFDGWSIEKQKLDSAYRVVHPKPREVWYIKIGINIGKEIYGKEGFFRPVLVINKLASMYFCIPLSTKSNNPHYTIPITFSSNTKTSYIIINQGRVYDSQRFFTRLGIMTKQEFDKIKNHLRYTYFPNDF